MKSLLSLAAVVAISLTSAVNAAEVTFDLTQVTDGVTSETLTQDGVSLTIDNPTGAETVLRQALGGLALSDGSTPGAVDLLFSQNVRLVSYVVSNAESDGEGAFFDLVQSGTSSLNNDVSSLGLMSFTNTTDTFLGGLVIALISGDLPINGGDEFEAWAISSITVETVDGAVPVPGAMVLMGSAFAAYGASRRKRQVN